MHSSTKRTLLLSACYAAVLVAVGALFHPIGVATETDRYHWIARGLLHGDVIADRFHPFLFPLLTAGVSFVTGSCFSAAKVVSSLAAGLLLFATVRLAIDLFGPRRAAVAGLLISLNGHVVVLGVQSASDVTAAAFVATTCWLAVRYLRGASAGLAFALGAMFALAASTRYPSAALLPALAATLWMGRPPNRKDALRYTALAMLGVLVGWCPHGILSTIAHGSPIYSDSWHNMVLKYEIGWDGRLYSPDRVGSAGAWLGQHWRTVLEGGSADLWQFVSRTCSNLLFGMLSGWTLPTPLALIAGSTAVAAMGLHAWRFRRVRPIGLFALFYVVGVCMTFSPDPRTLLSVLAPLWVALCGLPLPGRGRLETALGGVLAAALVLLSGVGLARQFAAFVESHPVEEVRAAKRLPSELGRSIVLASTYYLMSEQVPYLVWPIHRLPEGVPYTEANCLAMVRETVDRHGCDVAIIGSRSMPEMHRALAGFAGTEGLEVLERTEHCLVLWRATDPSGWIAEAVAETGADGGGPVRFRIVLAEDAPLDEVAAVGFLASDPSLQQTALFLDRVAERAWSKTVTDPMQPGDWWVVPAILCEDKSLRRGAPILLRME